MDMEPKRMENIDPISPNERAVVECFRKIKGRIRLTKFFGRERKGHGIEHKWRRCK